MSKRWHYIFCIGDLWYIFDVFTRMAINYSRITWSNDCFPNNDNENKNDNGESKNDGNNNELRLQKQLPKYSACPTKIENI